VRNSHHTICAAQLLHAAQPVTIDRNERSRSPEYAAESGKSAQPQISAQLLKELIPGRVTKEQFEDIFQNFKKAFI
jgi:hypothetical protein